MTAILLTGMSGTGKSTALVGLAQRGHEVVDTDDEGWCEEVAQPDGSTERWWREDRMTALLDGHRDGTLFVGGCVANQGRLYDRFAAVVLLSAPLDVVLDRVARRTTNPYGSTAADRARIAADLRTVEPLLRAGATREVDTRRPPEEVVEVLVALAVPPPG